MWDKNDLNSYEQPLSCLNRFNHMQHLHMSISTLAEFNSFIISFPIKPPTMMNDGEKTIVPTLILRARRKKRVRRLCHKDKGIYMYLHSKNFFVL